MFRRVIFRSDNRTNLRAASQLLTEAGYRPEGGRLVKGGVPLSFEFLAQTRQQERVTLSYGRTLERLGIGLRIRQVDAAAMEVVSVSFAIGNAVPRNDWPARKRPVDELPAAVGEATWGLTQRCGLKAIQPDREPLRLSLSEADWRHFPLV